MSASEVCQYCDQMFPFPVAYHHDEEECQRGQAKVLSGKWRVTTETSVHLLDYDNMTVTRLPGEGGPAVPDLPTPTVNLLRKDAEPVPLLEPPYVVLGQRMILHLGIRDDGTPTVRVSTYVQAIEECVEHQD